MNIPLVDLRAQHDELRAEIDAAVRDIIDRSSFIGGPYVEAFERDFAAYCGVSHAIGCASGTDALKLALMAVGVRPGDVVITVPHTFIATVEAISLVGAHPIFVDIDAATYTMSPARLAEYVETDCRVDSDGRLMDRASGRPVTAIIPVHLYGLPADMDPILALAERHGLKVVEDACQAHGAVYWKTEDGGRKAENGGRAGTLGDVGCFSFYPGKNLGAMGEAGALVTDDAEIAQRAHILRDHGQRERYVHVSPDGWNGRLDALQAAVLSIKLRKLDEWNEQRRRAARWYNERLSGNERITLPVEPAYGKHVYHLYVVRVPERDRQRERLAEKGVATGLHYPIPLHLQEAYRRLGHRKGDFPVSEEAARSVLSLPMYPHLTEAQVDYICRSLREALNHS